MSEEKFELQDDEDDVFIVDSNEDKFDNKCIPQLKRTPKHTWAILSSETCERFSYYGIKAVLVIYLTQGLNLSRSSGKAHYHGFSMVSYCFGIVGAMIADSLIGKYKTIFWSLLIYTIGEIILTLTTVPEIGRLSSIGPLLSLYVIASACGNIKPCMAAFGGEQFNQKDTGLLSTFFSMFYMSVNVGATLTMIFVPMIRTDIKCFGGDCYTAVFGFCTIVIVLSTVSFVIGSPCYTKKQPKGNMMIRVFGIIHTQVEFALYGACSNTAITEKSKAEVKSGEHWLYYAQSKYQRHEIDDVRALLRVLVMYIPVPMFWAVFNQQGSSWTLQAEQMNGNLGSAGTLRSDQIQFFNPVLVLIMIPLFDHVLYPLLLKCNVPLSPLKKMTVGMVLAAISFAITGFLQMKIQDIQPSPVVPLYEARLKFINMSPCERLIINSETFTQMELPYDDQRLEINLPPGQLKLNISGENCFSTSDLFHSELNMIVELGLWTVLYDIDNNGQFTNRMVPQRIPKVNFEASKSRVRLLHSESSNMTSNASVVFQLNMNKEKVTEFNNLGNYVLLQAEEYNVKMTSSTGKSIPVLSQKQKIKFDAFAAYTVLVKRSMHQKQAKLLKSFITEDIASSSIHRIWQLPQYIVITAGEILFSVTGLEFAYSQAPSSMKSVLQACWILTVALGDLIVVIFSVALPKLGIEKEMFMYGGIMLFVTFIFAAMAYFYVYTDFSKRTEDQKLNKALENEDEESLTKS